MWHVPSVIMKSTSWFHCLLYALHAARTNIHCWLLISLCFPLLVYCYPSLFCQHFCFFDLCLLFTVCGWILCLMQPEKYFLLKDEFILLTFIDMTSYLMCSFLLNLYLPFVFYILIHHLCFHVGLSACVLSQSLLCVRFLSLICWGLFLFCCDCFTWELLTVHLTCCSLIGETLDASP